MQNRGIVLYMLLFVLGSMNFLHAKDNTSSFDSVSFFYINSAITPATYEYLKYSFEKAPKKSLLVIKMNTPGGLISTTKEIMGLIGQEKRPVAVWVTPQGASAASAGAIIASSAHYIFMSPGTTIGAATPVGLGGDLNESDGKKKILNDLTALVRSFNSIRERNNRPFEEMILNASSFTEKEALKAGIIHSIVSTDEELLRSLHAENVIVNDFDLSFGQSLLETLSHPTTAYILFLAGLALIYFEFHTPGGYVAGSIGFSLLILAAMAFQVLPMDWGYFGLIIMGIFLLILELYVTSYGILFVLGFISFALGTLFMFDAEEGFITIQYTVLISTLIGVLFSASLLTWYILRENKKKHSTNVFDLNGAQGTVLTKNHSHYQIKVRGEIWNATSEDELQMSDEVVVIDYDPEKLLLKIKLQRS